MSTSSPQIRREDRSYLWRLALLAVAVICLYIPVLTRLVQQWWDDANYSHGFLIPFFAAFLVWERRKRLLEIPVKPSWWGIPILLGGLCVLALGLVGAELFLARVSLLIVIFGLIVFLGGWAMARALAAPVATLLLMIPIPTIIYNQVVLPLQVFASKVATATLQITHLVPVIREGNILVLPNVSLEVAEACSGIRSLLSLFALTIIYGYFGETRVWIRVVLCAAVAPIAVISNAARVVFDAVAAEYWGKVAITGIDHLLSGIVLFLTAFFAMVGFHSLLVVIVKHWHPKGSAQ